MNEAFDLKNKKKLGFGLMRLPGIELNNGEVDLEKTQEMIDLFMKEGYTYFDTAYLYGNGLSEEAARKCLVEKYPRDSFTIATKLPLFVLKSKEQVKEIYDTSISRLGVDYLDYFLIHNLTHETIDKAEEFGVFDFFKECKEKGLAKHIGFSCHDTPEFIDKVLSEHPEFEFVQLQINYVDWEAPSVQARACYETVVKHGLPVVVMEPIKGGSIAGLNKEINDYIVSELPNETSSSIALRFAADLEGVAVVLSGMNELYQVEENTKTLADHSPLNEKEKAVIEHARYLYENIDRIPCTACRYCAEGCPQGIDIPRIIKLLNDVRVFGLSTGIERKYSQLKDKTASICLKCGQCESVCPQHLSVLTYLDEAIKTFGN